MTMIIIYDNIICVHEHNNGRNDSDESIWNRNVMTYIKCNKNKHSEKPSIRMYISVNV